jgi:ubiquinol-cytochrome c reductase iron-sulfur subunit
VSIEKYEESTLTELPPHQWRPTDVDPALARRAERQIATWWALSMVCSVLVVVSYVSFAVGDEATYLLGQDLSHLTIGLSLTGMLLFFGIGTIQWARKLMGDHEIVEMRHSAASPPEDRAAVGQALELGIAEAGISRRPLLRNMLLGSLGLMGLPAIVLLRDLGPLPGDVLQHTIWRRGMRVVRDVIGTPIKPADLIVGDLVNAQPEPLVHVEVPRGGIEYLEGIELQKEKAKSSVLLLRMEPQDNNPGEGREDWAVDGILAYSKICTHVGCPISLNERTTHHLLCPCHQSTFDLADSGKVVFGPAGRALPQLPLMVDEEGYLVAQDDFNEPVGPSFWERNSK